MFTQQISVFIENKKGRLAKFTDVLAQENLDIIAISIADTTNFGILRCIVKEPQRAISVLKEAGFTASATDVIAVDMDDKPGGLNSVLKVLTAADVSVEYLYSFTRSDEGRALILFRVDDNAKAISALQSAKIKILDDKDVHNL